MKYYLLHSYKETRKTITKFRIRLSINRNWKITQKHTETKANVNYVTVQKMNLISFLTVMLIKKNITETFLKCFKTAEL